MKKFTLFLVACCIAIAGFSQINIGNKNLKKVFPSQAQLSCEKNQIITNSHPITQPTGNVYWSNSPAKATYTTENFDGTWLTTGWTQTIVQTTKTWKRGNPTSSNFSTIDPSNVYSAICPYSAVGATQNEWLKSPSITGTSGATTLMLKFWAGFSYDYLPAGGGGNPGATLQCKISTDGGTNWTTLWDANNTASFTGWVWREISLDITSYKSAPFMLAWVVTGADGDLMGLDNISIAEPVANDIRANKSYLDLDGTGYGYYEVLPYSQMGTVSYGEAIYNNGTAAQTNVVMNVNINNSAYTASSTTIASMAAGAHDTLWAQPTIPVPGVPTLYAGISTISQTQTDANPTDNIGDSLSFVAYPNYFSRTQNLNNLLSPYSFAPTVAAMTGMEYGANYYFTNADQVDSISAIIYDATPNTSITAKLYTITGSNVHTLVGQSSVFPLVPANLPAYITLALTTPYTVTAGTALCASIAMTTNIANNDTIFIGSDDAFKGDAGVAGAVYLYYNSAWGWYSVTGTVPNVDLVLHDPTTGINNIETDENISVYPNPANDKLYINANNITSVEIYNLIGEVVASYGNMTAINTSDLSIGTYIVKVITDSKVFTQKINIVR